MKNFAIVALTTLALLAGVQGAAAQTGHASWYGYEMCKKVGKTYRCNKTASGEKFLPYGHTAAHRTLKFGTRVKVTNLRNGRSVIVRINDRGPFVKGRIIDLAKGAAGAIGMSGTSQVSITQLK